MAKEKIIPKARHELEEAIGCDKLLGIFAGSEKVSPI